MGGGGSETQTHLENVPQNPGMAVVISGSTVLDPQLASVAWDGDRGHSQNYTSTKQGPQKPEYSQYEPGPGSCGV